MFNPVSKSGKEALGRLKNHGKDIKMDINDFYQDLYVEPFFCNNTRDNKVTDDKENEWDDFAFNPKKWNTDDYQKKWKNFGEHFISKTTNKLLFIRGSSGSGKTIYLNYLKLKRGGEILDFDLEYARSYLQIGDEIFPHENDHLPSTNGIIPSAPWLFLIHLLEKTFDIIFEVINSKAIEEYENIKQNFYKIYGDDYSDSAKRIFDFLSESDCIHSDEIINDLHRKRGIIFRALLKFCIPNHDNVSICIIRTLEIMTRFYACNSGLDSPKQLLIVFDSIEHYIDVNKRIYDNDIRNIVDSVLTFTKNEVAHYNTKGLVFEQFFKIVMVVRDTTNKMFSRNVHNYFSSVINCSIDVTLWYSPDDIYKKKLSYIEREFSETSTFYIELLSLIISDKEGSNNSIMDMLSLMYNFNKRRIIRILSRVADIFTDLNNNPEENKKVLTFDKYKSFWGIESSKTHKYLPRRAIIRLILNLIRETGFFRSIYVENLQQGKNTLARRTLIWLSRKTDVENEDYVSFYELIEGVLRCVDIPEGKVQKEGIKALAEILIALDEYRFEDNTSIVDDRRHDSKPNRWCQLIVIKHNESGELNADILYRKMLELYSSKTTETDDFGIKITQAGCFFTYIQSDFEYFACRYDDSNLPLLFMLDVSRIQKTINCVYNKAKNCIDQVIMQEYEFTNGNFRSLYKEYLYKSITTGGNEVARSLPLRIIRNHRNYLLEYKNIVDRVIDNKNDKYIIINTVDDYIKKYEYIFNKINNNEYVIDDHKIINYFDENAEM
jgi:hypothetical protein